MHKMSTRTKTITLILNNYIVHNYIQVSITLSMTWFTQYENVKTWIHSDGNVEQIKWDGCFHFPPIISKFSLELRLGGWTCPGHWSTGASGKLWLTSASQDRTTTFAAGNEENQYSYSYSSINQIWWAFFLKCVFVYIIELVDSIIPLSHGLCKVRSTRVQLPSVHMLHNCYTILTA